jgi:hypothetical protein
MSAALLDDGRVLVVEGLPQAGSQLQLYDPTTGQFGAGPRTPDLLGQPVTLADGRVLMAACGGGSPALLFDPVAGTLSPIGSGAGPDCRATPVRLADGRVLMLTGGGAVENNDYIYDPSAGRFEKTGTMTISRRSFATVRLADGRVLVAGGNDLNSRAPFTASAEVFDPATGAFSATGPMATPRGDFAATLLADGDVLVAGGLDGSDVLASAELYDPATGQFSQTGSMTTPRQLATATLLDDGDVLLAGGSDVSGHGYLASAELYDPASRTFAPAASMAVARAYHTATPLKNGSVLIAGGNVTPAGEITAELYRP